MTEHIESPPAGEIQGLVERLMNYPQRMSCDCGELMYEAAEAITRLSQPSGEEIREAVEQRTPHDCTIACMAMLTGRTYEDVLAAVGDVFVPDNGMRYEQKALERLGFDHSFTNGEATGDIMCPYRDFVLSPEFFRRLAWGRRALMTVPSLNYPESDHMIFWDGGRVWDPSPAKKYTRWDELKPTSMVLFREPAMPLPLSSGSNKSDDGKKGQAG